MRRLVPKKLGLAGFVVSVCLAAQTATASEHPCKSQLLEKGDVFEINKSKSFSLAGSGGEYVLSGLHIPDASDLKPHVDGRVIVSKLSDDTDRYRRFPVHVFAEDEPTGRNWVQGALLSEGLALVHAAKERGACLAAMRRAERVAERAGRGLWASRLVLPSAPPGDLLSYEGRFVLVEGTVRSVGDRKSRLYLNFGSNWSEDFTVSIVKTGKGAYLGDIDALLPLKGRIVRVRGMMDNAGGPLIRVFHESQIEILPAH